MRSSLMRLLAGLALAAVATTAQASGWNTTRDYAMQLRERGQAEQAYSMVAQASVQSNAQQTDREFLAGFLALRALGRPEVANGHFQKMALSTAYLKGKEQNEARSTAGYWLARTLQIQGKAKESRALYEAAALYRDTFYGLLAASQIGLANTPTAVAGVASNYPNPELFWHDPRMRKELVLAIIKNESSFRPAARSHAGAMGAMQLMPGTVNRIAKQAGIALDHRMVASNFDYNVVVGSKHFADLLADYNGNVMLSAAAYNAGGGRANEWMRRFGDPRSGQVDVVDWIELVPFRETRGYIKKVVATYVTYMNLNVQNAQSR